MTTRAMADAKFIRRYLFIAAVGLGFGLWGVYDSMFKFPRELEMAVAFDEFKQDVDAEKRWRELAERNADRGWTRERPEHTAEVVRGYINFNRFVTGAGTVVMLFFLWKYFHTRGSWIESSDTGIRTSWGAEVDFDKITKINKRRWDEKGIAKITFQDSHGRIRNIVIDDLKYEREKIDEMMSRCEQGLSSEQIVGGKSQAEIAAAAQQKLV